MSIRTVSILMSLLAHGTLFYYLGNFNLHDRPPLAASGQSLKVALVRSENSQQALSLVSPESRMPQKPVPKMLQKPAPKTVGSPTLSKQQKNSQQLLTRRRPTAAGRMKSSPVSASSKHIPVSTALSHREPPQPKPVTPENHRESTPAEKVPDLASISTAPPSVQPSAVQLPDRSKEGLREIEQSYMRDLVAAIERHKRYPLRARKKGYEGEVKVHFTVLKDGTISHVEIGSSSLRSILDRAAFRAVRDLGHFQPIPPQLGRDRWEFQVPIRFAMN